MKPYRVKHIGTGLYYKPGQPNLSHKGKVYTTALNVLSGGNGGSVGCCVTAGTTVAQHLQSKGYTLHKSSIGYNRLFTYIPKTEFILEEI